MTTQRQFDIDNYFKDFNSRKRQKELRRNRDNRINQYGKEFADQGFTMIKIGIAFRGSEFGFAYKTSEELS